MSIDQIKKVFKQFRKLLFFQSLLNGRKIPGHIHITGGEPLMHSQIDAVLDLFAYYSKWYSFGIMSNGALLNDNIVSKLKKIKLKAFQVSLDGNKEMHDYLRASGSFEQTINAMDFLHLHKIPCRVSFTANDENYLLFSDVAKICREHNVSSLWSDRYIPFSEEESVKTIHKDNMKKYVEMLFEECKKNNGILQIQNFRALQFLAAKNTVPYKCLAGEALIVVDEHGEIFPCRRMPIPCGKIKNTTLLKVYYFNNMFRNLRKHKVNGKCQRCTYRNACAGGLRCLSYAVNKDYNTPDPGCYHMEEEV